MAETAKQPSAEPDGTAIMTKIKEGLGRFNQEDRPLYIWIGSEAYYKLLSANMDGSWEFKDQFDNEKARIFGIRFIVDDECGDNAICYAP